MRSIALNSKENVYIFRRSALTVIANDVVAPQLVEQGALEILPHYDV